MDKYEIAKRVREAVEKIVPKLISKYEQERSPHYGTNLTGLCGISSFILKKAFEKYGYKANLVYGNFYQQGGHAWIECDGFIWDITATQFGEKEKVLITHLYDERYIYAEPMNVTDFRYWSNCQKPTLSLVREILSQAEV